MNEFDYDYNEPDWEEDIKEIEEDVGYQREYHYIRGHYDIPYDENGRWIFRGNWGP